MKTLVLLALAWLLGGCEQKPPVEVTHGFQGFCETKNGVCTAEEITYKKVFWCMANGKTWEAKTHNSTLLICDIEDMPK